MRDGGRSLGLRAGDVVEVRPLEEILATLDDDGCLEAMPFMPEMERFCGQRFTVLSRAHKTCDTVHKTGGRGVRSAVHLAELRCDGSGHGGCQAACLLFFKEAWLRRVPRGAPRPTPAGPSAAGEPAEAGALSDPRLERFACREGPEGAPVYRCQATELPRFSTPLSPWDPRQYLEDLWSGNVGLVEFVRVMAIALFNNLQRLRDGGRYPGLRSRCEGPTPRRTLALAVGERVRIRPKGEIEHTLKEARNRGLWFDVECVPYCGSSRTVQARVERLVDERTGEMVELSSDCLILEDVVCRGHLTSTRLFCPRRIYPYWREIWLEREGEAEGD